MVRVKREKEEREREQRARQVRELEMQHEVDWQPFAQQKWGRECFEPDVQWGWETRDRGQAKLRHWRKGQAESRADHAQTEGDGQLEMESNAEGENEARLGRQRERQRETQRGRQREAEEADGDREGAAGKHLKRRPNSRFGRVEQSGGGAVLCCAVLCCAVHMDPSLTQVWLFV